MNKIQLKKGIITVTYSQITFNSYLQSDRKISIYIYVQTYFPKQRVVSATGVALVLLHHRGFAKFEPEASHSFVN